jgi:hypothetical protein
MRSRALLATADFIGEQAAAGGWELLHAVFSRAHEAATYG